MTTKSLVAKLGDVSPDLAASFKALRKAVNESGPLGLEQVEFSLVGALIATRQTGPLRTHLRKLLDLGVEPAAVRQIVVAPMGAAATLLETTEALDILEELLASR